MVLAAVLLVLALLYTINGTSLGDVGLGLLLLGGTTGVFIAASRGGSAP